VRQIAPNLNFTLFRPALANPPLCSYLECKKVTLDELLDMHEILDLRRAMGDRAAEKVRPNGHR